MFNENYEKLNTAEQETFKTIVQYLLAHTYLVETEYDFEEGIRKTNHSYLFAERHLSLLQEYFRFSGFSLEHDSNYGVIALHSEIEGNRVRFDPITTKIIFTLRLLYDEKRSELSLSSDVFVTVSEICEQMMTIGAIQKRIPQMVLRDSLRKISGFQVIQKQSGNWYDPNTRLLILPSILFVVTAEQVTSIQKLADSQEMEDEDEEAEAAPADTLV